jgi:hypothetical protein
VVDVPEVDPRTAAAESQLQRLDDEVSTAGPGAARVDPLTADPTNDGVTTDGYGFHLDDPETDLLDDDLDTGLRDDAEADAIDAVAELFNARDLDGLLEVFAPDAEAPGLLGYDLANLGAAIEDLWQRRPTACLTRGRAELEYVGVMWEHDGSTWWRVAAVHVDDVVDGRIGVLEFTEDPALLEQVIVDAPDDELEEGTRWREWDEGDDT